eukprot:m.450190 g.450190  ORF g.450190 m.450190 type:complete len:68 (+) comp19938_c0_seq1:3204-3407(+)
MYCTTTLSEKPTIERSWSLTHLLTSPMARRDSRQTHKACRSPSGFRCSCYFDHIHRVCTIAIEWQHF